jgi:hypothetical protein
VELATAALFEPYDRAGHVAVDKQALRHLATRVR